MLDGQTSRQFVNDLIKPLKGIALTDGDDQTSGSIAGASVKSYTFLIIELPQDIKYNKVNKHLQIQRNFGNQL